MSSDSCGCSSPTCSSTDVWAHVTEHLSFQDVCACREVCAVWRDCLVQLEDQIARRYARDELGDEEFWSHARRRPERTRRSLSTLHAEMVRLDTFRRATRAFHARDFYELWRVVDAS